VNQRFKGKVIVITGAAGDIGTATALRFAAEGASLVAVDSDAHGLARLAEQVGESGGGFLQLQTDVTSEASVQDYVSAAVAHFGGIDALFNNAGIEGEAGDVADCDMEDFDRVMAVNVRGVLLGMKYAVPHLQVRGGGSIVNTASVAGMSGAASLPVYSASKHAVIGLTRSVARQQGPNNIRVNAVCPSAMNGRMMTSIENKVSPGAGQLVHEAMESAIPMGRYAEPADVASMVAHLCSDEAAFLNGGVYTVDGGFTS
jgi:3alpha(or 20beta)-hydroxysteroid dehydrogenase